MERTKPQIAWAITLLAAAGTGFLLAFWITRLDPERTGGSILAMPAILTATGITVVSFIFGLVTMFDPIGRRLLAFPILTWLFIFVSLWVLRA